jgi:hypothetical protein
MLGAISPCVRRSYRVLVEAASRTGRDGDATGDPSGVMAGRWRPHLRMRLERSCPLLIQKGRDPIKGAASATVKVDRSSAAGPSMCAFVYCPRFALSSSAPTPTNHPREWAMSRSRKVLQASSCATAMYSSALCACSIEPGRPLARESPQRSQFQTRRELRRPSEKAAKP